MPSSRNLTTPISIGVAVVCAAWALYATQHRNAPAAAPPPGAGARGGAAPFVMLAAVRSERVSQKLEALGNARANESVDISTKLSNIVTAVTFRDGERVKRGQVLVRLDDAQARADVAAAQAALTESESQYNRSRELLHTQALSKSSFDQLEGTLKANRARLGAAQARLEAAQAGWHDARVSVAAEQGELTSHSSATRPLSSNRCNAPASSTIARFRSARYSDSNSRPACAPCDIARYEFGRCSAVSN